MNDLVLYSSAFGGSYEKYMTQVSTQTVTAIAADKINENINAASLQIQRGLVLNTKAVIENVRATTQLGKTMIASAEMLNITMENGFDSISDELGAISASFSGGLAGIADAIERMSEEICSRLDEIHDIVNNPLLTASRELYRRAATNYQKKFYEEALEDVLGAVKKNKTDYISWFLAGQLYLFGAGEFSNVINVTKAEEAFMNVAKYVSADVGNSEEATKLAAEAYFYLAYSRYILSNENRLENKKEECNKYLESAIQAGTKAFSFSNEMNEALYNNARCYVLLGKKEEALDTIKALILNDCNYIFRLLGEKEFEEISSDILRLIEEQRLLLKSKVENTIRETKQILDEIDFTYSFHTREEVESGYFYKEYIVDLVETDIPYVDLRRLSVEYAKDEVLREKMWAEERKNECFKNYDIDLKLAKLLEEFTLGLCSNKNFYKCSSIYYNSYKKPAERCLRGNTFLVYNTDENFYGIANKKGFKFFPYKPNTDTGKYENDVFYRRNDCRSVDFSEVLLENYPREKLLNEYHFDAYLCYKNLKDHYEKTGDNEINRILNNIEEVTCAADKRRTQVKEKEDKRSKIITTLIILAIVLFIIVKCVI